MQNANASQNILQSPALAIVIWNVFNISTLILNKYLFQELKFTYPVSLTSVHMLVCFLGSYVLLCLVKNPNWGTFKPLPSSVILSKLFPLAVLFCVNIVLGNFSLRFVPVSFMQTVKSSTPAIIVVIQVLFFGQKYPPRTFAAIALVVLGVAATSVTEINFDFVGFICAVVASVITAVQAILTGKLLSGENKLDSMNVLIYMSPISFLLLLPYQIFSEYREITQNWSYWGTSYGFGILLISGLIALGLNISTFLVVKKTSALTYTVFGNLKVVFSITISVLIFKNEITLFNALGCATAIAGVYWYNMIQYYEKNKPEAEAGKNTMASQRV